MKKLTLSEVFRGAENLDWKDALYLPKDKSLWGLSCEAIMENPDSFSDYDSDDNPVEMAEIGYRYVILCDDITSICANLSEQIGSPSEELMYEALMFYLEHDAFISVAGH